MSRNKLPACRWLLGALSLGLALNFTAAVGKTAPTSGTLSLWKVTSGGHILYLAGSMHALTQKDLPLPAAYTQAFDASDRLVEELDLKDLDARDVTRQALAMGLLKHKTLQEVMGKKDWSEIENLARKSDIALYHYQNFKPWLAAIGIGDTLLLNYGYQPQLGLDLHFAHLAKQRDMPGSGLETVAEQLSFFDDMKPAAQRRFLLQTLREADDAKSELAQLHDAWAQGDMQTLEKLQNENFKGFPALRKRLIKARNERWLPHLEKCLHSGRTCFVVVGVEHMVGPYGLIALMKAKGEHITQMHGSVRVKTGKN